MFFFSLSPANSAGDIFGVVKNHDPGPFKGEKVTSN